APPVVQPADELAHDEEIDSRRDRRPEVRVDVERAPEPDQPRFGASRAALPLWAADGAEEHRVGAAARLERLGRERVSGRVDRGAADQPLLDLDLDRQQLEDAHRLGGHLRADPVAGETDDPRAHAATPSSASSASASASISMTD